MVDDLWIHNIKRIVKYIDNNNNNNNDNNNIIDNKACIDNYNIAKT